MVGFLLCGLDLVPASLAALFIMFFRGCLDCIGLMAWGYRVYYFLFFFPILFVHSLGLTALSFIFWQLTLHLLFLIRLRVTTRRGLIIQRSPYYYFPLSVFFFLLILSFPFLPILFYLSLGLTDHIAWFLLLWLQPFPFVAVPLFLGPFFLLPFWLIILASPPPWFSRLQSSPFLGLGLLFWLLLVTSLFQPIFKNIGHF